MPMTRRSIKRTKTEIKDPKDLRYDSLPSGEQEETGRPAAPYTGDCTYTSTGEQDENIVRLLSYLSDLAKDITSKKYSLVFKEYREEIDMVLDTHTPVLTKSASLFINSGGQMNPLIVGDNLASLKLLEKPHKSKIDLIDIDHLLHRKS